MIVSRSFMDREVLYVIGSLLPQGRFIVAIFCPGDALFEGEGLPMGSSEGARVLGEDLDSMDNLLWRGWWFDAWIGLFGLAQVGVFHVMLLSVGGLLNTHMGVLHV